MLVDDIRPLRASMPMDTGGGESHDGPQV
jgi:hypothetical protein